jgi:hypothetical protein
VPAKRDHTLFLLGKYVSLALLLPASAAAGYFLGAAAGDWLHAPALRAVGILAGVAAGVTKILQELAREDKKGGRAQ